MTAASAALGCRPVPGVAARGVLLAAFRGAAGVAGLLALLVLVTVLPGGCLAVLAVPVVPEELVLPFADVGIK